MQASELIKRLAKRQFAWCTLFPICALGNMYLVYAFAPPALLTRGMLLVPVAPLMGIGFMAMASPIRIIPGFRGDLLRALDTARPDEFVAIFDGLYSNLGSFPPSLKVEYYRCILRLLQDEQVILRALHGDVNHKWARRIYAVMKSAYINASPASFSCAEQICTQVLFTSVQDTTGELKELLLKSQRWSVANAEQRKLKGLVASTLDYTN